MSAAARERAIAQNTTALLNTPDPLYALALRLAEHDQRLGVCIAIGVFFGSFIVVGAIAGEVGWWQCMFPLCAIVGGCGLLTFERASDGAARGVGERDADRERP